MTFDPNEPRDDHGKWTSGGSGGYDSLTVTPILNGPQVAPPGTRNNGDIAKDLDARAHVALKAMGFPSGSIETPKGKNAVSDPKADNVVSSAIANEIEAELKRGGNTAENWYTQKVDQAMKTAAVMHPELKDNPSAKFGYTAALAVTSQGETVPSNTRLADDAYSTYAKTGKFPTNVVSATQKMMNSNFGKLNGLIAKLGTAGAIKFLNQEFTAGELEKMGYGKITGENKSAKVYGSAILGPKIGQGFYQNLNGNYKPLTADMWFMRSWGRLTGTLTGQVPLDKPIARFTAALKAAGQPVPKTQDDIIAKADEVASAHEKDFRDNREAYDSGAKKKSELSYAAERIGEAVNGIKDQPSSGGQRQHMRDVFAQAQQKLADAGRHMTTADMQATWWYPEKRLYSKMGGRSSDRTNTDYATALRTMAKSKGFTDAQIDKAVNA